MNGKGRIWIGTSNVVVPGNKSTFPPEYQTMSRLHYYATMFNTVEVNSCFYKIPLQTTYTKWSADVPDKFRFSLKLNKEITHVKDMNNNLACVEKFMQTATGVEKKKGCILIQFPGKVSLDLFHKVEEILTELQVHDPDNNWNKAVEFRNQSWYVGETRELLEQYGATIVLNDHPKGKIVDWPGKASFVYIRFHGPSGNYRDSYTDEFLMEKSIAIRSWLHEGKDVYAYFNNTIGNAFDNAVTLKNMLQ